MAVLVDFLNIEDIANHREDILPFIFGQLVQPLAGQCNQAYSGADAYRVAGAVKGGQCCGSHVFNVLTTPIALDVRSIPAPNTVGNDPYRHG